MEYLVDPDAPEEEHPLPDVDPELLLREDHYAWLTCLINCLPKHMELAKPAALYFCVSCSRYLNEGEEATIHQTSRGAHHLFPMIRVQPKDYAMSCNYYVSVQALSDLHVPIGDVMSHVLPHPPPLLGMDAIGFNKSRCMYVHPQNGKSLVWSGETISGKCAFRACERIFNNRHGHLRHYGITPQFCSVECKINCWLNCKM